MLNPEFLQAPVVDSEILGEIHRAETVIRRLGSPVLPTQVNYDWALSRRYGAKIWVASELHQDIGAFKIRGADNAVQNLTPEERERGVVAASAGNHAQGVAQSCYLEGIDCSIMMPELTPSLKVDRTRHFGGETTKIFPIGATVDESLEAALAYCKATGAVLIHPFNNKYVIAGQGTWGKEIAKAVPELDYVISPIGGGGLIAGVATAVKDSIPNAEFIGVESAGANSFQQARDAGKPVPLDQKLDTFVDGTAVGEVGDLSFRIADPLVKYLFTVSNEQAKRATTDYRERGKRPYEVELAASLSAAVLQLKQVKDIIRGKNVVLLATGRNLDSLRYEKFVKTHRSWFLRLLET